MLKHLVWALIAFALGGALQTINSLRKPVAYTAPASSGLAEKGRELVAISKQLTHAQDSLPAQLQNILALVNKDQ